MLMPLCQGVKLFYCWDSTAEIDEQSVSQAVETTSRGNVSTELASSLSRLALK